MTIHLLEDTLEIDIFYECEDQDLEDNICISVVERCPPDEKLFRVGKTLIYLTSQEAHTLGKALISMADQRNHVD
jgi:hypothetical protein